MRIDIGTLIVVMSLFATIQAVVLLYQYRLNKVYPGIGWWAAGSLAGAAGFFLNVLREMEPFRIWALIAGNGLLVAALILFYIGVARFLGRKERRGSLLAGWILLLVLLAYYTLIDDQIVTRVILVSAAVTVCSLMSVAVLWRNRSAAALTPELLTLTAFLLHGVFFGIRTVEYLLRGEGFSFFTPTLMQTLMFVVVFISNNLWTFGFVTLVNQRLHDETREAKERFEVIFHTSPDAAVISRVDDGRIAEVNEGFCVLSGYSRSETVGKFITEVNLWQDRADRDRFFAALRERGACDNMEAAFRRKDGREVIGMISGTVALLRGEPHVISITRDISARKQAEAVQRHNAEVQLVLKELAETALLTVPLPDLYAKVHHWIGRVLPARNFYIALLAEETGELVLPYCVDETNSVPWRRPLGKGLTEVVLRERRTVLLTAAEIEALFATGEVDLRFGNVSSQWLGAPLIDGSGKAFGVISIHSIAADQWVQASEIEVFSTIAAQVAMVIEHRHLEEELKRQATTDELTGLMNRRHFLGRAGEELKRVQRYEGSAAFLILDIDHFKQVNDTYGHATGDDALRWIAAVCNEVLRDTDLLGRIGGEEFAALLLESDAAKALLIGERLRRTIQDTLFHDAQGQATPLRVSIGATIVVSRDETVTDLMRRADKALYQAKAEGRNRIALL